jgi:hypothetical protein
MQDNQQFQLTELKARLFDAQETNTEESGE